MVLVAVSVLLGLISENTLVSAPPFGMGRQTKFEAGCVLPFDEVKIPHDIDGSCGREGAFKQERHRRHNLAKNNFCETGTSALATFVTFDKLQQAAIKAGFSSGGPSSVLEDRTPYEQLGLKTTEGDVLGEGSLVRMAGYIVHADFSNENSGGENVNCNENGEDWNDIHINLASNMNEDDFCKTVVVEMSPHFRPRSWEEVTHVDIRRPVRVTRALVL
jgi:hypothetical protein